MPDNDEPGPKRSKRATASALRHRPTLTLVFEHSVRARPAAPPPQRPRTTKGARAAQDCSDHDTGMTPEGPHQEGPDRISTIHRAIARVDGVEFTSDFAPADETALRRVHSDGLIASLRSVQDDYAAGRHVGPRPLSPVLVERMFPTFLSLIHI